MLTATPRPHQEIKTCEVEVNTDSVGCQMKADGIASWGKAAAEAVSTFAGGQARYTFAHATQETRGDGLRLGGQFFGA